jgi:hypothetical protein
MSGVTEFELVLSVRSNLCPEAKELEINLDSEIQLGGDDCET